MAQPFLKRRSKSHTKEAAPFFRVLCGRMAGEELWLGGPGLSTRDPSPSVRPRALLQLSELIDLHKKRTALGLSEEARTTSQPPSSFVLACGPNPSPWLLFGLYSSEIPLAVRRLPWEDFLSPRVRESVGSRLDRHGSPVPGSMSRSARQKLFRPRRR